MSTLPLRTANPGCNCARAVRFVRCATPKYGDRACSAMALDVGKNLRAATGAYLHALVILFGLTTLLRVQHSEYRKVSSSCSAATLARQRM